MKPTTLGVIADIQYRNDKDDYEVDGHVRSYRSALPKTVQAVKAFASRPVPVVWHLGDIIDGREQADNSAARDAVMPDVLNELDEVLAALTALPPGTDIFHVIGNHCLFVQRDELMRRLGLGKEAYYVKDVAPLWRIVTLDTLDVGFNRPAESALHRAAEKYLADHKGEENAVPWNGGCSDEQLLWLRDTLEQARNDGVNVIIGGHHPCTPASAAAMHVQWAAEKVTEILREFNDVVRAYFAGHFHSGGYALLDGVHHVTFNAVLDSDDSNSYAFVTLHSDKIEIEGHGSRGTPSRTLDFHMNARLAPC
jgi:manganese-dependent ADP-ribose/CDP-alcohol diphosphatase